MAGQPATIRSAEAPAWPFLSFGLAPAVVAGYLMITVADEMSRSGVSLGSVSALVATMFLPAAFMFVWAPLVDLVGRRQHWLQVGLAMLAVSVSGLALTLKAPPGVPLLISFGALGGLGYSLVSAAQKGLAVEIFAPTRRVAAAGWTGAGSGIGLALGGGVLALGANLPPQGEACLMIGLAGVPAAVSLIVLRPFLPSRGATASSFRTVAQDTGRLLRTSRGLLALAICVLPFASSGAALMVGALGVDFATAAEFVGVSAGTGKSLAFAAGALLGAQIWQRIGTRAGYVLTGILMALFPLLLLAAPRTPSGYAMMVCGFGLLQGASLSAILGFVLETVEHRAASTQAAVFVAAGNLPNIYLPPVAGWAHDTGGLPTLLLVDAAIGFAGLVCYLLCARILHLHAWRGG